MLKAANILTPEFRVSFPYLFEPQSPLSEGQKPKFSIVMLFKKDADLSALKNAVTSLIVDRYGADKAKWPTLKTPFRDQGIRSLDGYVAGAIFITASSLNRPGVVDAAVQPIIDPEQIYAGCYARASVRPFIYESRAGGMTVVNRGVSFGLQNVQKTRDGDPLGGRMPADKEFTPVASAGASLSELLG